MIARVSPAHAGPQRRPVLGVRREPGRLALALFRMPLRAYRHDAGWMLGRTFIEFTHVGRKTGQSHDTVAMVLHYNAAPGEAVVCSAWGPDTDWFRNLRVAPPTTVRFGRDRYTPQRPFLGADEAFAVAVAFRPEHPRRLHLLQSALGWGDLHDDGALREFVTGHPMVAFRPKTSG